MRTLEITVTKTAMRMAYARNGNTHNPTITWKWSAVVNGQYFSADKLCDLKSDIIETFKCPVRVIETKIVNKFPPQKH